MFKPKNVYILRPEIPPCFTCANWRYIGETGYCHRLRQVNNLDLMQKCQHARKPDGLCQPQARFFERGK